MIPSLKRVHALMSAPQFNSNRWKLDLAEEFVAWQAAYTTAQTLKPSSRFGPFHQTYLAALRNFNGAVDDVVAGIDNVDATRLQAGTSKMLEGATLLNQAIDLLEAQAP
ncbi:MAG: hypothetical protein C4534_02110 [Gaiellales bacterium]|nr:MAG: hypothetical protein C4534_02110 [Gaiellales bacterium]